jgi:hypothetical protein
MNFRKTMVMLVALLAIAAAGLSILRHCRVQDPDRKAGAMYTRCGAVMAELTGRALGGPGRIVVLEPEGELPDPEKQQWLVNQRSEFDRVLGRNITVAGRERVPMPLTRDARAHGGPGGVTLQAYRELLDRYPDVQAVVSFVGAPQGTEEVAGPWPRMVCFCFTGEELPELMGRGIVTAAVAPRRSPVPVERIDGDWFDILYEVVTPENVGAWAQSGS